MHDPRPLDVIAVGAHPDDVEIACGGTLARLASQGVRVGIVDLTNGEPTPLCDDPAIRLEEAREAAKTLGVPLREVLSLPNRTLFDSVEARLELARVLRRHRPKIVIGFGDHTPLASPDHWQAMQITDGAIFYSRLTKWDDRFDGVPPHRIHKRLYFQLAFEARSHVTRQHEFHVDISDFLTQKLASIRCYRTQFPEAKQYVFERVESAARFAGSVAGCPAAEVFSSATPILTDDLLSLMGCEPHPETDV